MSPVTAAKRSASRCVERGGDGADRGVDVDALDAGDVEAPVLEQHGGKHAVPAADHPDLAEAAAEALDQPVARPDLAGHLLVVERIGDVGVGVFRDDAGERRRPADWPHRRQFRASDRRHSRANRRWLCWVACCMAVLYVDQSGKTMKSDRMTMIRPGAPIAGAGCRRQPAASVGTGRGHPAGAGGPFPARLSACHRDRRACQADHALPHPSPAVGPFGRSQDTGSFGRNAQRPSLPGAARGA